MPNGVSGWDLAALARRLRPGVAVLLTSGHAHDVRRGAGAAAGGAQVLGNPCAQAELARRLDAALKGAPH